MHRILLTTLALLLLAPLAAARSRTSAAVDVANAAKAAFHAGNAPPHRTPEGAPAPNRTLKVVIADVDPAGFLVLEKVDGKPLGTIDPRTIPALVAQDRSRFGGRKHLGPEDLEPGLRLKLTLHGRTSEVLRAKVLRERGS